ncbi:hypothetical protein PGH07_02390 [Sulfurovum sp. zt1-1]|uniref:Uncharacterized protein n=1 Tax=Sulfurovum zhangzhouensis TaxID=3019067 RepID=A0ABT7QW96_9BACT|nr:hypothetical protein [Sulfurovum zhangzhouensis]MDM5271021.1 hypothetical protein [Sulfurovum zhangzhouensis]
MFLKKSSSQSAVKNIVTLNAYAGKYYQFKDNTFQPFKKLTYNTSNFIASYVSNKDLITTTVYISRSIPEEDIPDIIDIKAYEELGLDQAKDYLISYTESKESGEEREFHIFVAEPDTLDISFLSIKEETKYIDLLAPAPLLYKALYKKEILDDNGTQCFVYFTKFDAFVTLYHNGEFLYSKSIDFSLETIYNKYCELIGEQVEEKEFFNVLEQEGMKTTREGYQENLMKIFGEVFITINDIIIYAKRAFELDRIDQMFIGTAYGPIIGLDDYSQNYLGLQSSEFNFNYHIECEEWYTDQLQFLMLLSAFDYLEDETSIVNLTRYPRPPSFVNRASGQFIISTFAAISVGLAYPLVYLVGSYINDATVYALNIQNDKVSQEASKYKKILAEKKAIITQLDDKIAKLSATYQAKTKTLTSIYDKKINYRLKSGIFHTLAGELDKYDVHVEKMKSDNDVIWLSLVSSEDRKLTELIKYISDNHFQEINQINIELIEKDPESNYYKGLLKVDLK